MSSDLSKMVAARMDFERLDMQVKAFRSATWPDFYVVTVFGFPTLIHVQHHDKWYGSLVTMAPRPRQVLELLRPFGTEVVMVEEGVLTDIYRRGFAGLVKHRLLGGVVG